MNGFDMLVSFYVKAGSLYGLKEPQGLAYPWWVLFMTGGYLIREAVDN